MPQLPPLRSHALNHAFRNDKGSKELQLVHDLCLYRQASLQTLLNRVGCGTRWASVSGQRASLPNVLDHMRALDTHGPGSVILKRTAFYRRSWRFCNSGRFQTVILPSSPAEVSSLLAETVSDVIGPR
jgi:hypothetical protein